MRDRKLLFSPNHVTIINNFLFFFSYFKVYYRFPFLFLHKIHVKYSGLGDLQLPILLGFFHKIRKVKGLGGGGKSFMGNVIGI